MESEKERERERERDDSYPLTEDLKVKILESGDFPQENSPLASGYVRGLVVLKLGNVL